jgi:hypothetical protein
MVRELNYPDDWKIYQLEIPNEACGLKPLHVSGRPDPLVIEAALVG